MKNVKTLENNPSKILHLLSLSVAEIGQLDNIRRLEGLTIVNGSHTSHASTRQHWQPGFDY